MQVCMNALKEVSKVWLVAKMVHTLFESILGNKLLEERLQKAPGKRHKKPRLDQTTAPEKEEQQPKRKYEDMELGFANGPPAPQVSYERSRPQTPAVTPSRDLGQPTSGPQMAAPSTVSPNMRQTNDAFLGTGNSRNPTRPPTPFNPSFSVPATPPDLYLVTRSSPPISQSLWENYQPEQLFPDGTNMGLPYHYTSNHQQNLDPQLSMPHMQTPSLQQPSMQAQQQLPQRGVRGTQEGQANVQGMQNVSSMHQMQGMPQQSSIPPWPPQFSGDSPEDSWSNSSRGHGPSVPTALNVEDW